MTRAKPKTPPTYYPSGHYVLQGTDNTYYARDQAFGLGVWTHEATDAMLFNPRDLEDFSDLQDVISEASGGVMLRELTFGEPISFGQLEALVKKDLRDSILDKMPALERRMLGYQ